MLALALALLAAPCPHDRADDALQLVALDAPSGASASVPFLATGADGEVYLSWMERSGPRAASLLVARLEDDGFGEPRTVVQGDDLLVNWADFPSVAALADGTLVVQWLRLTGQDSYAAEFALSTDTGQTWSAPRRLHDDEGPGEHGFVSLVVLDADHFGALWLDGRLNPDGSTQPGDMRLYYRTLDRLGVLGPETLLDERVCSCCQTGLSRASDGSLLAIYRDRSMKEVRDIASVRFDGKSWSEPAAVHADSWVVEGCPVNGPRVLATSQGAAAVWFTGAGGDGGSVRAAFSDAFDGTFGAPIRVDEGTPEGRVDAVVLADGSLLVSWLEHAAGAGSAWCVRRVSRDGSVGAPLVVADVPSERASGFLRMTRAGKSVFAAWRTPDREVGVVEISFAAER